jgi:Lon-like protease
MRKLLLLVSLAVVAVAAVVVPTPYYEVTGGPTIDVGDRVVLDNIDTTPITGSMLLTTVRLRSTNILETLRAVFDGNRDLVGRGAVVPPGVDEDVYRDLQERLFDESARTAAVVGLAAAGYEASVTGAGAQVLDIVRGGPAEGVLRRGDIIVEAGGEPVRLASDLVRATSTIDAGQELVVRVRRADETITLAVVMDRIDDLERPGIGVVVQTVAREVRLPAELEIRIEDVGGPSGGLMLALAIYDLASPDDVAGGRIIAGTGTIDARGRVGPVGGVAQKVRAAIDAGATIFLSPEATAEEARQEAGDRITVIAVASFDAALRAVRVT